MRAVQRAPANVRPQRVAGRAAAVEDDYAPPVDAMDDFDGLEPLEDGDDDGEVDLDAQAAGQSGFTRFWAPTRDFPPCPRMAAAPPGADMHWDPQLRCFAKPPLTATNYDYFMHFFDHNFFQNGLLAHTQAASPSLLITASELWTYLALRMVISCHPCISIVDFFTPHDVTLTQPAPFLADYMSHARFNEINGALRTAPPCDGGRPDKFYLVRSMLQSWQEHQNTYGIHPGHLCCTDESMMEWMNKFCPGWQYVERKPMPWGNLFHTCACAVSKIVFSLEIMEGKDRPEWMENREFEDRFNTNAVNKTKIGGLIMRMAKPLFNRNCIVVHDSGFSCVPAMKELLKHGVYSSMLFKKKRFFPRFTDGAANAAFLEQQEFLMPFYKRMQFEDMYWQINMYRDTAHLTQLGSNYGTGVLDGRQRYRFHPTTGAKITFKHVDAVDDYFYARTAVDEHNRMRQGSLSFEQGWQTKKWHVRIFAFLVGMSETNAKNAAAFFRDKPQGQVVSLLAFRMSVAQQILDIHAAQMRAPARRAFREQRALLGEHHLSTIPVGCGRYTGKRDREHIDGFKKLSASRSAHKYQCQRCKCGKQIRTYCLCSPAHPLCIECYADHRVQVALAE
jgi:hypothetical protein